MKKERTKTFFRQLIIIVLVVLTVFGAFIMPSFESVLSLLGNALGMLMMVLIPMCAYAAVYGWKWYHIIIAVVTVFFAITGTICSFLL